MRTVSHQFDDYASYHRTAGNKLYHRIGIPLIMLSLIGMLARITIPAGPVRIDAAILLIAAAGLYYLFLEWRLAVAMLALSAAFYVLGSRMPLWLLTAMFVLGWVAQFIGHAVYEKRRPAFTRNLIHLLIGPLWILNDLLRAVPPTSIAPPKD